MRLSPVIAALVLLCAASCPPCGYVPRPGVDGVAVKLTNRTDQTICQIRAVRCDLNPPISYPLFSNMSMAPGSWISWPIPVGCWNFKAEDCDHHFVAGLVDVKVPRQGAELELTPPP